MDLKQNIRWNGSYRRINFEIQNFNMDDQRWKDVMNSPTGSWTFYLYLPVSQFPPEYEADLWLDPEIKAFSEGGREHLTYDYYGSRLLRNIDWHCGITWYSKESGLEPGEPPENRIIKAGCDYQHYWDNGHYYSVESVLVDVHEAIDSIWELINDRIRLRCNWCGRYDGAGMTHPRTICSGCLPRPDVRGHYKL